MPKPTLCRLHSLHACDPRSTVRNFGFESVAGELGLDSGDSDSW